MSPKLNDSIRVIFERVLPSLKNAGFKYWVYGGIGVAGAAGKPVRDDNSDVDIYVLSEDFFAVEPVLRKLCEEHNVSNIEDRWDIKPGRPLKTGRPKWDFLIGGHERLSVIPIYNKPNGVDFKFNQVFHFPKEAMEQEIKIIDGYEFYSPPCNILPRAVNV